MNLQALSNSITPEAIQKELLRRKFRKSFFEFVKHFWDTIIAENPVWNWHIEYMCNDLQNVFERLAKREVKEYDYYIYNVPPGSSKSTIISEMLPIWAWTIDPAFRYICGSYASTPAEDIASKCYKIYTSEKFGDIYPELVANKSGGMSNFKNGLLGERYTTSTGSGITGIHAHAIICLPYDQTIKTDKGCLKIGDIVSLKIDCKVLSYNEDTGRKEYKKILKFEKNPPRKLVKIKTKSGREFRCTYDHLVFTHNRGYVEAINLTKDDIIEVE